MNEGRRMGLMGLVGWMSLALAASAAGCGKQSKQGPAPQTTKPAAAEGATTAGPAVDPAPSASAQPAAAPTKPAPSASAPEAGGRTVEVMGYTIEAPEKWVREQPRSRMRLAQFKLPKVGDDPRDGVATVIVAGGDVQANVNRWRGQFQENPPAATESLDVGGVSVTLVRIAGTFMEKARPMAPGPGTPREGYAVRAIIAPLGEGQAMRTLFVKAWGPVATIQAYEKDVVAMAKSLAKKP